MHTLRNDIWSLSIHGPHKEVDQPPVEECLHLETFNSRPHKEVDPGARLGLVA